VNYNETKSSHSIMPMDRNVRPIEWAKIGLIHFSFRNKMLIPSLNVRSMQRASPPKRGAVEPVNLKTLRNPAITTPVTVRSRSHFFARISCVFKECASNRLGRWFCAESGSFQKTVSVSFANLQFFLLTS
jgi:hypothetical protein